MAINKFSKYEKDDTKGLNIFYVLQRVVEHDIGFWLAYNQSGNRNKLFDGYFKLEEMKQIKKVN